jgi:bifunctional non-homologous end joining protein LigD
VLQELPARSAVVDGEVAASDADGRPNSARLHLLRWVKQPTMAVHLWAFDLLVFNGRDLRPQPFAKRKACLQVLMERFVRSYRFLNRSMTAWRSYA